MEQGQHPPTAPAGPVLIATPLRPTAPTQRIEALDVARGVALLGIFFVNVHMMSEPIGSYFMPDLERESLAGRAVHHLTRTLFEAKSYPLFSMLFGMGMVLMHDRARAAGRAFFGIYYRRLAMLLLIGLAHAFLLWHGDVLAYYAIIASVVVLLVPLRARYLFIIAGVLVTLAALMITGLSLASLHWEAPPPPEVDPSRSAFAQLLEAFRAGGAQPYDAVWINAETEAFRDGPYINAVSMRAINWFSGLVFWLLFGGTGLHIAGMFVLGAAIMRSGFFRAANSGWVRMVAIVAGAIGLPAAVLITWVQHDAGGQVSVPMAISMGASIFAGPMVSMFYLSLSTLAAHHLPRNPIVLAIASAGRMALTNYLAQTVIIAIIMQHWGFARFGTFDRATLAGLVVVIYAVQLVWSVLWLRVFRMGPLEWCWRGWTYLRVPNLLARRGEEPSGEVPANR